MGLLGTASVVSFVTGPRLQHTGRLLRLELMDTSLWSCRCWSNPFCCSSGCFSLVASGMEGGSVDRSFVPRKAPRGSSRRASEGSDKGGAALVMPALSRVENGLWVSSPRLETSANTFVPKTSGHLRENKLKQKKLNNYRCTHCDSDSPTICVESTLKLERLWHQYWPALNGSGKFSPHPPLACHGRFVSETF